MVVILALIVLILSFVCGDGLRYYGKTDIEQSSERKLYILPIYAVMRTILHVIISHMSDNMICWMELKRKVFFYLIVYGRMTNLQNG